MDMEARMFKVYAKGDEKIQLKVMPLNQNGKIDRKWLKNHYHEEEK